MSHLSLCRNRLSLQILCAGFCFLLEPQDPLPRLSAGQPAEKQQAPQLALQRGPWGKVDSLAFSPDGKTLAACQLVIGSGATISLWDVTSGELRCTMAGEAH